MQYDKLKLTEFEELVMDQLASKPPKGFKTVTEKGVTFLRHSGTGEETQLEPERLKGVREREVRAPLGHPTYKVGCVKYVDPRHVRKHSWKTCDVCNKWQVVSLEEFRHPDRKFMCDKCVKNNKSFKD